MAEYKLSYTGAEVNSKLSQIDNLAKKSDVPTKTSQLTNDSGFITGYTETDPTVPAWAKASTKPTYTKSEIGLGNVDNVKQYSASNPPPYPVTKVNNKTGEVSLTASDVGADASGTASSAVSVHNTSTSAHSDIREQISELSSEKLSKSSIVQEAGASESLVMSQKAVTEQFAQVSEAIADKVSTAPQTLTEAQKAQARENIGASSEPYVLTDTDKSEIKEAVKEEIPLIKTAEQPTFVNSVDECTDTEKIYVLPDGYMYAHGTKYRKQYTNVVPTATGLDGNIYNGIGIKDDMRLIWGESGDASEQEHRHFFATGFFPCKDGDIVRITGFPRVAYSGEDVLHFYDSSKTWTGSCGSNQSGASWDDENKVLTYDIGSVTNGCFRERTVVYARMCAYIWDRVIDPSSIIITVNEEIVEGEVEGFHNTSLVYQPMDCEERVIELEKEVAELKETNGGGNVTFDYAAYGLPELALTGDVSAMTKDNAVTLDYVYGDKSGTCTCKWQGSSSIAYPKKNYTIKFDNAFEAVEGWGEQKKYCLKANYIDHSHARNVVSAKLWGQIVKSRTTVNEKLTALPNGGAIDGFPCVITINGEYKGLYTFNIPKDGWMFGMGSGTSEAILCADKYVAATQFRDNALADGTDFDLEYASNEDDTEWVATSLNQLINACINSDGTDLDTTIAQYLDWESAMDYYIFTTLLGGQDMMNKNYILATYDGVKWFFSAYDMDSTYGLWWDGKKFEAAGLLSVYGFPQGHQAMELILNYKKDALKARYKQLRKNALSDSNVLNAFTNFICQIPERIYLSDTEVWPGIPSSAASNLAQIVSWYQTTAKIIDAQMEAL